MAVLRWLVREKYYTIAGDLLELSEVTMRINVALDALRTDSQTQEDLRALLA